ncbi:hypothetical protein H5410_025553 [Solanum commersonii]|uniref:Uncharacterized protein n=1 Tax=Solanum commersonii TaxID=4109 RepID=A0A9J5YW48_SOLCO|nr:hypothetical protein H5410_025553 [Solanum commersonii]
MIGCNDYIHKLLVVQMILQEDGPSPDKGGGLSRVNWKQPLYPIKLGFKYSHVGALTSTLAILISSIQIKPIQVSLSLKI